MTVRVNIGSTLGISTKPEDQKPQRLPEHYPLDYPDQEKAGKSFLEVRMKDVNPDGSTVSYSQRRYMYQEKLRKERFAKEGKPYIRRGRTTSQRPKSKGNHIRKEG